MSELKNALEAVEQIQLAYRWKLAELTDEGEQRELTRQTKQQIEELQTRLQSFVGEQAPIYIQQLVESADTLYEVQRYRLLIIEQERAMEKAGRTRR